MLQVMKETKGTYRQAGNYILAAWDLSYKSSVAGLTVANFSISMIASSFWKVNAYLLGLGNQLWHLCGCNVTVRASDVNERRVIDEFMRLFC